MTSSWFVKHIKVINSLMLLTKTAFEATMFEVMLNCTVEKMKPTTFINAVLKNTAYWVINKNTKTLLKNNKMFANLSEQCANIKTIKTAQGLFRVYGLNVNTVAFTILYTLATNASQAKLAIKPTIINLMITVLEMSTLLAIGMNIKFVNLNVNLEMWTQLIRLLWHCLLQNASSC